VRTHEITIKATEIPKVTRLYRAVHGVLLARLLFSTGAIPIDVWNELISAHDDICPAEEDGYISWTNPETGEVHKGEQGKL
jgi:hypothetical protein